MKTSQLPKTTFSFFEKLESMHFSAKTVLLMLCFVFICLKAKAQFTGSGTSSDPYLISNAVDLTTLATNVNSGNTYSAKYFQQTTNIDYASASLTPIGVNLTNSFRGIYNGNGYSISHFTISGSNYLGVFRNLYSGTIKNLGVTNATVNGGYSNYIAALVGHSYLGNIQNCYVSNCNVTGYSGVAALVGASETSTISQCYSSGGTVTSSSAGGGLVGVNMGGTISNCYSSTAVTATNGYMGGLVGQNTNTGTITNCYASGSIGTGDIFVGGLVGSNNSTVTNSYWDKNTTGRTTSAGSVDSYGKTTAEMKTQSTFTSWDFTTTPIWKIDAAINNGYPYLATPPATIYVDASKADDSGNGLSWNTAKKTLQAAISQAVSGDKIWVKAGTYKPGNSRNNYFALKSGVSVYGGFVGTEASVSERVISTNETILSGEIGAATNTDNCYIVVLSNSISNALLDGFTIKGGYMDGNPGVTWRNDGGGIHHYSSQVTYNNLKIIQNYAQWNGSGVFVNGSELASFNNCLIANNTGGPGAGALTVFNGASIWNNCTFTNNSPLEINVDASGKTNTFNNCIVWGGTNNINITSGTAILNYCNYQSCGNSGTFTANNCKTSDPKFVDAANGDYRLYGNSPCVDAGNDSYNSLLTDIRGVGFGRKLLKTNHSSTGTIDIGAYEYKEGTDPLLDIAAPTTQASNLVFSSVQTTQMTIGWTNGNGSSRAVFVKAADTGTASPVDNTIYTANTTFISGTQICSTGWYCVYNGTGTSVTLTGLTAGTDYIAQVFEYDGAAGSETYNTATATDNPKSQTTLGAPKVTTQAATNITNVGATLNASVNANGFSTTVTFEYGTTTAYGSTITAAQSPVTGTNATTVSAALTGLAPNTTYYYRAKGVNAEGTVYGTEQSFTANLTYCTPSPSTSGYTTMWITNVTTTGGLTNFTNPSENESTCFADYSATKSASQVQGGSVTMTFTYARVLMYFAVWIDYNDDGIFESTEKVIATSYPTNVSFSVPLGAKVGSHRMRVRGEYNGNGIPTDPCTALKYGETEDYTFTVVSAIASTVTTQAVTNIASTTATGNGNITNLGVPNPTQYGVVWSTSTNPTVALTTKTAQGAIAVTGAFTSSITGLSANTKYYVKAYATNSAGTSYGTEVSFTTNPKVTAPSAGDGTSGNPYQIANLDNLNWLSQNSTVWDKYFIQTADIDATITSTWNSNAGFSPIGTSNTTAFTGNYNGQGFKITNLFINRPTTNYISIFGYVSNATITNLGMTNVNITGNKHIGGLIGQTSGLCTVTNCYTTGSITGIADQAGGLIGKKDCTGTVSNCYSNCNITCHDNGGGLIAAYRGGVIEKSFATGNVNVANNIAGGLVGEIYNEVESVTITINNCYAKGNVSSLTSTTGLNNTGGFVGHAYAGTITINKCYSTGIVRGNFAIFTNGFIGNHYKGTVNNCFFDAENDGLTNSTAGINYNGAIGKTTADMKAFATFNAATWDFKDETTNGTAEIWNIGNSRNDGYPYLSWQYPTDAGYKMPTPTITSATYNGSTAVFELTCTNIASGDVIVPSKFTITGQGGNTYTLTTANVTASSATTVNITLNATDKTNLNKILNKNGTSSIDATSYNLAAADKWNATVVSENMADANSIITVSNLPLPTISEFSPILGIIGTSITITGTNFRTTIAENEVYVGTVKATVTAATATSLTFTIPTVAATGKIKVVLDNGQEAISEKDLIVVVTPSFTSSAPVAAVGYKELFNYIATINTGGDETTNITLPTKPTWLTQTGDFVSKPKAFVTIPSNASLVGVTTDNEGNTFSITFDTKDDQIPLTIYKTTPDGTTTTWKENLLTGFVLQLHISDGYIYIPRLGDKIYSITRIPLANPAADEEIFASLKIGAAAIAEKDGYMYVADYFAQEIVKINKLSGDKTTILSSADGIPDEGVIGLSFDTAGNLLIPTYSNKSILKYNGINLTTLISNLPGAVTALKVDKQNDIYVAFEENGLRKYKPDFSTYESLSVNEDDLIFGIHLAESGAVLYSTMSNSIYKLNPSVTLQGTPDKSNIGPNNVVIRATNSAGYTEQSFTINVVDNVSPVISAFSPATTATNVALKPTLNVTFDEEVSLGTSGILGIYDGATLVKTYDLSVPADRALFELSTDKMTVSITLTEDLSVNTVYAIGLGAGFVKDKFDNDFAGFKVAANLWQFTTINKVAQTITYPEITAKTYGADAFTLGDATTDKGLTVTYTATDESVVSIVGNQATILKTGETKITATQNGNNSTFAASTVERMLKVNKAPLTITAENKSKMYDGQVHADFTVAYAGFVKNETAAALSGTLAFEGTAVSAINAGAEYVITPKGVTSNNYNISFENGKLEITQRSITITADPKSKVYGDADPSFTAQITSGSIVTGDAATGNLKRAIGENVNIYAINQNDYSFGSNYNETFVLANLTITQRPITITADPKSKVYGDADPSFTAQITSGSIVTGDVASGTLKRAEGENVNIYAINQNDYSFGSNYNETFVPANLTITQRPITITADPKSKVYGDADPSFTAQITSGSIVTGDVASGTLKRASGESVNIYAINQNDYSFGSNYSETFVHANLTITQRPITITADAKTKTYGYADPSFTAQITSGSIVTGDIASGTLKRAIGENVNIYAINQNDYSFGSNYNETFVPANLTITQRPITITADPKSKVYGDADPSLTAQVSAGAIVTGDAASGNLKRVAGENVNIYAINQNDYSFGPNYNETFVPANLTIGKRPITINADAKSKVYGDADPSFTAQITSGSIVTGDVASGNLKRAVGENVNIYAINQNDYSFGANYKETFVPANLTITQRPITITADAKSKTYGETDPSLTAQVSAGTIVTGDAATGNLKRAIGENVNTYAINKDSYSFGANYNETFVPANLTITKRTITITADPKSKVYGNTDPSLTAQITSGSIVTGDVASGTLKRVAGENVNIYAINQNDYSFGANYSETFVPANLTIIKRPVNVTAIATTKTYDCSTICHGKPIVGTLANGDVVNKAPTQAFDNLNVGSNHVLMASGLTIKNINADVTDNYIITYLPSAAAGIIRAKQLTITDPSVVINKMFDGTTSAAISTIGNLQGLEMADASNVSVLAQATYNSVSIGNDKVITVSYTLSGSAASNYLAPVNYTIYNAKIAGEITLSPLTNPSAACEVTELSIEYAVLSGVPTKYKLTFSDAAIAAGMVNVPYTALPTNAANGTIAFDISAVEKGGTYQGTLKMSDNQGVESIGYTFNFTINVAASLIMQKFKNVIFVDDKINRATSFQWYKNGVEIPGANKQFYMDPAGLVGIYTVKLTTSTGEIVNSCEKVFNIPLSKKVLAYPNPVKVGQDCRVDMLGFAEKEFDKAQLIIFDTQGARVYQSGKVNMNNSIHLPAMSGVYVGQFSTADGEKYMFKIIVAD